MTPLAVAAPNLRKMPVAPNPATLQIAQPAIAANPLRVNIVTSSLMLSPSARACGKSGRDNGAGKEVLAGW